MKIIIVLLFTLTSYSQVSIYIPKNTIHFVKDRIRMYADNQGGDIGIVASFQKQNNIYTIGKIRNSFGLPSFVFAFGKIVKRWKTDFIFSFGISSGYEKLYFFSKKVNKLPKIFKSNGIIPICLISVKHPIKDNIGLQTNISPGYLNTGFYINLK